MNQIAINILACLISFIAGFALMFQIAKAMVDKVRLQEEARHQDLINQFTDAVNVWVDTVDDITDLALKGAFQNKPIKEQVRLIKKAIIERKQKNKDGGQKGDEN